MKKTTLILLLTFAATAAFAGVNTNAGIIFPLLDMGSGARALALGGAYTAIADDASAVNWNAAGLSQVKNPEISLAYDKWFMDTSNQQVMLSFPLGDGAIAADVVYMNLGSIDGLDAAGNPTNTQIKPYDLAGTAGYGASIMPGVSAGMAIKFIS